MQHENRADAETTEVVRLRERVAELEREDAKAGVRKNDVYVPECGFGALGKAIQIFEPCDIAGYAHGVAVIMADEALVSGRRQVYDAQLREVRAG